MPRACCVCKAGTNVDSHKFPQDPAKCKKWIEKLQMPELNLLSVQELQKYRVCYNHFSAEDYKPTRGVRQLKNTACPRRTPYTRKTNGESNQDNPASDSANNTKYILQSMEVQEICEKEPNENMDQRLNRTEQEICKKESSENMGQRLNRTELEMYKKELNDDMDQRLAKLEALVQNQAKQQEVLESTMHQAEEMLREYESRFALVEEAISSQGTMPLYERIQTSRPQQGTTIRQAFLSPSARMYTGNVKPTKEVKHVKRLSRSNN